VAQDTRGRRKREQQSKGSDKVIERLMTTGAQRGERGGGGEKDKEIKTTRNGGQKNRRMKTKEMPQN
jgi:hypothetical protein